MKKANTESKVRFNSVRWNLIIFAAIVLISLFSLFFTRYVLIENARKMGEEITYSYSIEEEHNLENYNTLISVGAQYIEELEAQESDQEVIREWITDYFEKMAAVIGENSIDPYAVVNGEIIALDSWAEKLDYDAYQTPWYQQAVAAGGEVIYTDAYMDAVYEKPVITIAKECGDSGNVIAFDIFPEDFKAYTDMQKLPEGSGYYVYDSQGALLYGETKGNLTQETLKQRQRLLYQKAQSTGFTDLENAYIAENGRRMEVYYRKTSSGWLTALVIPQSFLVNNWDKIMGMYLFAFAGYLIVAAIIWNREKVRNREIRRMNETVHILGESYYAYYRVNVCRETYEIIKGSDYVKEHLKPKGNYTELLSLFRNIIMKEDYEEFAESFSIENINKHLKDQVKDFGGDFRRLFDGEYKWVQVRMLFAPAINQEEMVLCFRHVEEERKRRLKRTELLEDALKAANDSKTSQKQFFSNISHDMRTPLNVIIGMSELAEKNVEDTEKARDYLQKINYSSKQMLALINDILEMSRLEQGAVPDCTRFQLKQSVDACMSGFGIKAQEEGKKFELDYRLTHETVYGDLSRLEQLLNNLVSNAMKFTKQGDSVSVRIWEIDLQEYTKYQIIVEDTGIGMTQEFLKKLFVPYQREKRFGVQSVEGTGLGMPIVRSIVSLMGGEIAVESEPDVGTKFTVTLPLLPADEEQEKEEDDHTEPDYELEGKRILLVEDYELNMEMTTDILQMYGVEVLQAWNGEEAVERFTETGEFSLDAILMDMEMPVMDGCTATRKIRSLSRADAKSIPIIALTANAFSEDIAKTSKAGMNAHIFKPIDIHILCETLGKLTDRKN